MERRDAGFKSADKMRGERAEAQRPKTGEDRRPTQTWTRTSAVRTPSPTRTGTLFLITAGSKMRIKRRWSKNAAAVIFSVVHT